MAILVERERMMNKLGPMLLVCLLALPCAAHAQIYKWKDKDGVMRYADTPPPGNTSYEILNGGKNSTTVPDAIKLPAANKAKQETGQKTEQPAEAAETPEQAKQRQAAEEAQRKARERNCSVARANLNTFQQGGRISRMTEQGEREYFDDAALAREIEKAKREIAEFCD